MIDNSEPTVFTTALIRNGEIQWLDEHLLRLAKHALALGIPHPKVAVLRAEMKRCLLDVSLSTPHLIRIALSRSGHELSTRPAAAMSDNVYNGAKIILTKSTIDYRLGRLKTGDRSVYRAAWQIAVEDNAFEALLIDTNGFVVDGSRSSPLMFCEDTLISLEGGIQGITREKVLERAEALGIATCRLRLKPEQLRGVLLVAGSGIGLVPSTRIDDRRITTLVQEFRIT